MTTLDEHARDIRRAVAALREHADGIISPTYPALAERRDAMRAVLALEDAIMRTLAGIGLDGPTDASDAHAFHGGAAGSFRAEGCDLCPTDDGRATDAGS